MAFIKISDAFKAGADWISATVRAFQRDQSALFFDTVQEVRDNDLEQARWVYIKAVGAHYRLNLSSTASDDGDTVVRDNIGRRYEKADIRERLTANRDYYVDDTNGSDSNNGLSAGSGNAFKTIQKAINATAALDLVTYNVTINVADGTYTGGVIVNGPWVGSGDVSIVGNVTTPANVLIDVTGNCFQVAAGGRLKVSGLKLQCSGIGLYATRNGYIEITGLMDFGACSSYHAFTEAGARIVFLANWNTTGSAFASLGGQAGGTMTIASRSTTITGTPAWTNAYASFTLNSLLVANAFTFSGSSTGARYSALTAGGIATFGGGASYFPGDSSGTATSPGWYT